MIKVNNVSRLYSDGSPTYALKNVDFTLPDQGMVFVIGKSGSGKSTLLNILAGFDKPTEGEIVFNNQRLDQLPQQELDYYRNSTIGFIFQDYCLIETLTVNQNIRLSMHFQKKKCKKKQLNDVLGNVGMEGFGKRLPRQLSAGQKQRIAIARALIKEPKIILADEPTGNLDNKTTKQILALLKEISKERLVIVVSHNKEDALIYADRILELGSGEILSYKIKNEEYINEYSFTNKTIVLPNKGRLTEEQLYEINEKLKKSRGKLNFERCKDEFLQITDEDKATQYFSNDKVNMGIKNLFRYSWLFFKHQLFSFFLIVLLVSVLITTLSISIQFGYYDGGYQYQEAVSKSHTDVLFLKQDYEDDISEEENKYMYRYDINQTKKLEKTLDSKSYPIMNYYLPISTQAKASYLWNTSKTSVSTKGFLTSVNNLVVCDKEYLIHLFQNEKKELDYIGDISSEVDGIIITDYVADAILLSANNSKYFFYLNYEDILNGDKLMNNYGVKISAIIRTDYKKEFEQYFNSNFDNRKSPEYTDMVDKLLYQYGIAYTTNNSYYSNYLQTVQQNTNSFSVTNLEFKTGEKTYNKVDSLVMFSSTYKLKSNEIVMGFSAYNEIFNKNCSSKDSSEFTEETLTLNLYDVYNEQYFSKQLKVVNLVSSNYSYVSEEVMKDVVGNNFYQVGVSVINSNNTSEILTKISEYDLYVTNSRMTVVDSAIAVITVFSDLFNLLMWIMIIAIIVLVLVNATNTINKNIYNIGVSRAMGAHIGELAFIYSVQMIAFGTLVVTLSMVLDYYSVKILNQIIVNNIPKVIDIPGVSEITYVVFNPYISSICTGLVVLLTIVSIFVPIKTIKKTNPVKIIKSR